MIGKESIAFNDRTGTAGDFLEKLLDFYFKLHARDAKKSKRGKRRTAPAGADQEPLELTAPRQENTLRP